MYRSFSELLGEMRSANIPEDISIGLDFKPEKIRL